MSMTTRSTTSGPGTGHPGGGTGDSWDAVLNNTHSNIVLNVPEQRKKTPAVATVKHCTRRHYPIPDDAQPTTLHPLVSSTATVIQPPANGTRCHP